MNGVCIHADSAASIRVLCALIGSFVAAVMWSAKLLIARRDLCFGRRTKGLTMFLS